MYNKLPMNKEPVKAFRSSADQSPHIARTAVLVIAAYIGVQMISDIASLQVVTFFGMALDAGTFIYPLSFTLRDVAHRFLGKTRVRWVVISAAAVNILMALYFYLISLFPINQDGGGSAAWARVLTPVWRITAASILAELISELIDTEIYSLYVKKFKDRNKWARVLLSNAVSIPIDSFLFAFIAFFGAIPTNAVWEIFVGNVVIKFVVTLFSIPLIYFGKTEAADS